jgi:hypothetical protein
LFFVQRSYNSVICVSTLVVPYNKLLDAVIVGAVIVVFVLPVIFPEPIVQVVISTFEFNIACFPFNAVSNSVIFVPTLLVPYNKLLDDIIVGAVIVVFVLPVIFPEPILPVVISIFEVNVACFEFNAVSNPSVLAIVKLPSVIIFYLKFILSC